MGTKNWEPHDLSDDALQSDRYAMPLPVIISTTCLLMAVGGIAYLLWDFDAAPKRSVETSQITVSIPGQPNGVVAARTRSVAGQDSEYGANALQVQLPDGQWIACGKDCKETLRDRL